MKGKSFTEIEKGILLQLVDKYKNVLENKKTDAVSNSAKEETWVKLTEEFNAARGISEIRTNKQLKKLWGNLKSLARNVKTAQKESHYKTGGGPSLPTSPFDEEAAAVLSVAPHLMTRVVPVVDSDFTIKEQASVVDSLDEILVINGQNVHLLHVDGKEVLTSVAPNQQNVSDQSPIKTSLGPNTSQNDIINSNSTEPSASSNTVGLKGTRKRCANTNPSEEVDLRRQRIEELIKQDAELFELKRQIAIADLEAATVRLETKKIKRQLVLNELQMSENNS